MRDDPTGTARRKTYWRRKTYCNKCLEAILDSQNLGEHDGNEFGGGEAAIYCYGTDAWRLLAGIESELRSFPARPASAYLRYGNVSDPDAREQGMEL